MATEIPVDTVYLGNLVIDKPADTDIISNGDDEIRTLKKSIQSTFPDLKEPILIPPGYMNDQAGRIKTKYVAGEPNNYIEFTTKINIPYLPKQYFNADGTPSVAGYDADYLSFDTDGSLGRLPPFSPLGALIISALRESEMEQLYPGIYTRCDGKVLDETSELFKILGQTPGSGYKVPDLLTNKRTVRALNTFNPLLSTVAGMANMLPNIYFETEWNFHDHVEGDINNEHYHNFQMKYNGQFHGNYSDRPYGSIRRFNVLDYADWTSGPKNANDTDWTLPPFTHTHTVNWTSSDETRGQEIRLNYFIRIN